MPPQARPSVPPSVAAAIDAALAARDFVGAGRLAAEALDAGHVHPLLLHLRAVAYKRDGRHAAALADLERAAQFAPHAAMLMMETADCLNALGHYERAVALASEAIARDPRQPLAWRIKGAALQSLADLDGAWAAFAEAARLDPSDASAHASLAQIAAGQSRLAEARRHATRALAIEPGNDAALLAVAAADRADGRLDEARTRLEAVLRHDDVQVPLRAMAKSELGEVLHAEGRTAEAFESYRDAKSAWKSFYGPYVLKPGVETIPAQLARLAAGLAALPQGPW
ncbi:MAG TPA: tetratricopeptide repeat protein [Rhizomicrobium sp.]|jgi:tetratricopeptide (TPR) repeat protein|nr:tetratricopeptide repeat protein [Rhizomicrobium sp.]